MKTKKILLLSIVSLSLIACGKGNESVSASTESSHTTTSAPVTETSKKTEESTVSESSASEEEAVEAWPESVTSAMNHYLENRIVPFIDMKTSKKKGYMTFWEREESNLYVVSTCTYIDAGIIANAKTVFEDANWTVETEDHSLTATSSDNSLTATLYVDSILLTLRIHYEEEFDPTKNDSYSADLISSINGALDNHADEIPYIYLGTSNLDGNTTDFGYILSGGIFRSEIISLAKTSIDNANKSITDENKKWTVVNSSSESYQVKRLLDDGCTINLDVYSQSGSRVTSNKYAMMRVTYKAKFTPSTATEWPKVVKEFFASCDNHSIPYFYVGSDNIYETDSSNHEIEFLTDENTWDNDIVTLAKEALENENKTISDSTYQWNIIEGVNDEENTKTLSAIRTYEDGCTLNFKLYNNGVIDGGDRARLEIHFEPKYEVPSGASWSEDTLSKMNQYIHTSDIPYVYLGTTSEKTNYNDTTSVLEITGGLYYSAVLQGAKQAFNVDGWTSEIKTTTATQNNIEYTYQTFTAEKTISDDAKIVVTVDGTSHSRYYQSGTSGSCIMKIEYVTTFVPPSGENASWDKYTHANRTLTSIISSNLDSHSVPFVYLNTNKLEVNFSAGENILYITGGTYRSELLDYAYSQFTGNSSWTDTAIDYDNNTVTSTCNENDGCVLTATFLKTNYGYAELRIHIESAFKEVTSYSDSVNKSIKTALNGHSLPLIQLGSSNPTVLANDNYITLSTSVYRSSLFDDAKAVLEEDGYTAFVDPTKCEVRDGNTYPYLIAFKKFDDGYVYLALHYSDSGSMIEASFHSKLESQTKTDWTDTEKSYIDSITENQSSLVPFFYMGDGTYSHSGTTLTGATLDYYILISYYQDLKDLGYSDISLYINSYMMSFSASHVDSDGNTLTITIKKTMNLKGTYPVMYITYTKAAE